MKRNKRKAILTADDFGASDFINKGVIRGIEEGMINSVAAMVNFPGALKSIQNLKEMYPHVSLGLHASITAGRPLSPVEKIPSLVDGEGHFYNLQEFIHRIKTVSPEEVLLETSAQMEMMEAGGVSVEHLSSHHNVMQVYTPLFLVLLSLAEKRNIPMRSTRPLSRFLSEYRSSPIQLESRKAARELVIRHTFTALKFMKYGTTGEMQRNQDRMGRQKVGHPDYLGDSFWGDPTPENLRYLLHFQPEGTTEWVFHLGSSRGIEEAPKGIDQEYFYFRELELFNICSRELPHWLERENIDLINFSDLQKRDGK